ncbi:MAG: PDZ domain-containing protein [Acidobacteriota bacterium]
MHILTLHTVRRSLCRLAVSGLTLLVAAPLVADSPDPVPRVPAPAEPRVAPPAPVAPVAPAPPCPRIVVNGTVVGGQARGFLGVEPTRLSGELRSHFGLPEGGVLVGEILDGSSAEAAGLQVGDLVLRIDDTTIDDAWSLTSAVATRDGGESVEIEYWRDGATRTTTAVLDTRERCAFDLGDALPLEALRELEALEDLDFDFDFDFDLDEFEIDEAEIERLTEESLAAATVAIEEAMQSLDAIDWEKELESLEQLEVMELKAVEERMEAIQERMEALERELEAESRKLNHDARREMESQRRTLERERRVVERERERVARQMSREDAEEVRAEAARARAEARREMEEARQELERELAEVAAERAERAEADNDGFAPR